MVRIVPWLGKVSSMKPIGSEHRAVSLLSLLSAGISLMALTHLSHPYCAG